MTHSGRGIWLTTDCAPSCGPMFLMKPDNHNDVNRVGGG